MLRAVHALLPVLLIGIAATQHGCTEDDCTVTLTCEPANETGGGGSTTSSSDGGSGATGGSIDEKKADGIGCGIGDECQSGLCIDAVCCATSCDGECESCDLNGTEGTCTPHAPGTDDADECSDGLCSGQPSCATGAEIWSIDFDGLDTDSFYTGVDSAGAFVVAGASSYDLTVNGTTIAGNGIENSVFVVKIAPGGTIDWSRVVRLAGIDYVAEAVATVDASDGVVVTGYAGVATSFPGGDAIGVDEFFVVRLDSDGAHDWTQTFPASPALTGPVPTAIDTDAQGNIYIFGTLENETMTACNTTVGSGAANSFFGMKLSPTGACLWADHWIAEGVDCARITRPPRGSCSAA